MTSSIAEAGSGQTSTARVRIAVGIIIVMASFVEAVIARKSLITDPDIWWHIKTGEWIWQQRALPTTDPFSFTYAGQPWIAKEWLSQLIYAASFAAGGWNLVAAVGAITIALSVALLYWFVSDWIKPSIAASVVLLCLLLTSSTFTVRPHLLTLPLLIVWTYQLFRASQKGEGPSYLLLAVLVIWANLHAAFTMGFVIAFFAFLDFLETFQLQKREALRKWLIFLVLCPLVTLLHPYSYKAMMTTLLILKLSDVGIMVSEWQPFNAQLDTVYAVSLLAMIFGALTSGFRLGFARSALILLLAYLFLCHVRYAFYLFPVLALVVVPPWAIAFPSLSATRWKAEAMEPFERRISTAFRPIAAAAVAVVIAAFGLQLFVLQSSPPEEVAATAAIGYLKSHRQAGNVMNYYDFGGPLIFNDIPTFVDGRSDQLFLGNFAKDAATDPKSPEDLLKVLDKYEIEWTLMPPGNPRTTILNKLPGWKRMYADKYAVIHQRTASAPPSP